MPVQHLQRYQGALFDSHHWTRMHLRPGDVVISTPPKCGTTWMLAMVYLLLNGWDAKFDGLSRNAPWIDHLGAHAAPKGPGRQLFKTHTPLDGIPIIEGVSYVAVFRDPGAAFLSMRRHLRNMVAPSPDHPNAGPWTVAFERFLNAPMLPDRFGGVTLPSLSHYLQCAEESATLILHYADVFADTREALVTLQQQLGLDLPDSALGMILDRTRRSTMAKNADNYFPTNMFKDNAKFFESTDDSSEHFCEADRIALNSQLKVHFNATHRNWLSRGA